MNNQPPPKVFGPAINRVADVMIHINRFAFHGVTRLAEDAHVSPSSVSRLINGKMNPSFLMVARVTAAVEKQLGYRIDPRDLVAECGAFLTQFACELTGCRGCLPPSARDEVGDITPAFAEVKAGSWVSSKYPTGYRAKKGDR